MALKLANNAVGNLAAPMTTGDTTLTLQSGQGARFPVLGAGDWHPVTVVKVDGSLEIMRATARTGDILTVSRAQEGTTALAFSAADLVQLRQTRASYAESLQRDGTVAMTGNLDLGTTNKIVNLAAGTVATDAVNKGQLDVVKAGVQSRTGFRGLFGRFGSTTSNFNFSTAWLQNAAGDLTAVTPSGAITGGTTTTGPGGRDRAANFNGQWIYWYIIWNGSTLSCIASPNYPVPDLTQAPGYTHWAFAAAVRVGATNNNMLGYILSGNRARYGYITAQLLNGNISGSQTATDMTSTGVYVPPFDSYVEVGGTLSLIMGSGNAATMDLFLYSDDGSGAMLWFPARLCYPASGVSQTLPLFGALHRIGNTNMRWSFGFSEGSGSIILAVQSFTMPNGAI